MSEFSILNRTVQRAVERQYIPASEAEAVTNRIIELSKKYGFSPDEFAMFSMIETDGLDPRADNGNCAGIIQFCCLSIDTEILTTRGWKKFQDVNIGQEILTWNEYTRTVERDSILDINYYKQAPVIQICSGPLEVLATPNHRWYVSHKSSPHLIQVVDTRTLVTFPDFSIPSLAGIHQIDTNSEYDRYSNLSLIHKGIEEVWCPSTKNRTWFGRRKGVEFLTGNSGTGAATVGYSNYKDILNLSTLEQLELVDQYFAAQGGPYSGLEDLYLTVLYPAARDIKDPNQCLGIPGQQASYLYDEAQGCITKNSIRAGLTQISQEKIGDVSNIGAGFPGSYSGSRSLSSLGGGSSSSSVGGSVVRKSCPKWDYTMSFSKVTTGCDMSGTLGFGSSLSISPGGTQGSVGAASGPANLTNIPVDLANLKGSFPWPVRSKSGSGAYGDITSPYGWRAHPMGGEKMHYGIDIAGGDINGAPLISIAPGVIIASGFGDSECIPETCFGGYGYIVLIQHERPGQGPLYSLYCHLIEQGAPKGSQVDTGTVIGKVGSTGISTGPHLHFEIRRHPPGPGSAVDPLPLLSKS